MILQTKSPIAEIPMPPIAIGIALFSFFCFSLLDASAKWLVVGGQAVFFVVWVRFAIQALFLLLFFKGWINPKLWKMERPVLQVCRGLLLPAMTCFNFLALQYLQLAETISVLLASPIVVAVLAGPMLGEWAGPRRWIAIFIGFIGVLIVVRPGTDVFSWPVLLIIGSMLCNSFYLVLTRKLASVETPESLIFYSCFFGVLIFAPLGIPEAQMPQQMSDWFAFALAGMAGMVGHMGLIKASKLADAAKVTPFIYTQIIWMTLLGFLIFGDLPDGWTVLGMMVVAGSGLYLWYREHKLRKRA
ncbi:DMT family transporter [Ahrensia kielensis]|uniref:DMT family transporter n=1 Tax=Ahrensia kielensis TaxID=76980 RepID=UPI0003656314